MSNNMFWANLYVNEGSYVRDNAIRHLYAHITKYSLSASKGSWLVRVDVLFVRRYLLFFSLLGVKL